MNWFRQVWQKWFGKPQQTTTSSPAPAERPEVARKPVAQAPEVLPTDGLVIVRKRLSGGELLGTLSWMGENLGQTLEAASAETGSVGLLPPGTHRITLHTEGGYHATYSYRFGSQHRGMLAVKLPGDYVPRLFRIGATPAESMGHVLAGSSYKGGILRDSDAVYQKLYARIAPLIAEGKTVNLYIYAS